MANSPASKQYYSAQSIDLNETERTVRTPSEIRSIGAKCNQLESSTHLITKNTFTKPSPDCRLDDDEKYKSAGGEVKQVLNEYDGSSISVTNVPVINARFNVQEESSTRLIPNIQKESYALKTVPKKDGFSEVVQKSVCQTCQNDCIKCNIRGFLKNYQKMHSKRKGHCCQDNTCPLALIPYDKDKGYSSSPTTGVDYTTDSSSSLSSQPRYKNRSKGHMKRMDGYYYPHQAGRSHFSPNHTPPQSYIPQQYYLPAEPPSYNVQPPLYSTHLARIEYEANYSQPYFYQPPQTAMPILPAHTPPLNPPPSQGYYTCYYAQPVPLTPSIPYPHIRSPPPYVYQAITQQPVTVSPINKSPDQSNISTEHNQWLERRIEDLSNTIGYLNQKLNLEKKWLWQEKTKRSDGTPNISIKDEKELNQIYYTDYNSNSLSHSNSMMNRWYSRSPDAYSMKTKQHPIVSPKTPSRCSPTMENYMHLLNATNPEFLRSSERMMVHSTLVSHAKLYKKHIEHIEEQCSKELKQVSSLMDTLTNIARSNAPILKKSDEVKKKSDRPVMPTETMNVQLTKTSKPLTTKPSYGSLYKSYNFGKKVTENFAESVRNLFQSENIDNPTESDYQFLLTDKWEHKKGTQLENGSTGKSVFSTQSSYPHIYRSWSKLVKKVENIPQPLPPATPPPSSPLASEHPSIVSQKKSITQSKKSLTHSKKYHCKHKCHKYHSKSGDSSPSNTAFSSMNDESDGLSHIREKLQRLCPDATELSHVKSTTTFLKPNKISSDTDEGKKRMQEIDEIYKKLYKTRYNVEFEHPLPTDDDKDYWSSLVDRPTKDSRKYDVTSMHSVLEENRYYRAPEEMRSAYDTHWTS